MNATEHRSPGTRSWRPLRIALSETEMRTASLYCAKRRLPPALDWLTRTTWALQLVGPSSRWISVAVLATGQTDSYLPRNSNTDSTAVANGFLSRLALMRSSPSIFGLWIDLYVPAARSWCGRSQPGARRRQWAAGSRQA